ncbi:MAG: transposase [Deltaproteobacteria bacterium]|nr:transposase [Deltaproteobacteria bacterium]
MDNQIDWKRIEALLLEIYPVGKAECGNRAYPPLMLMKALLLQKWFGIKSDPELENQINDRISFKSFIGLPLAEPAPDHSLDVSLSGPGGPGCLGEDSSGIASSIQGHGLFHRVGHGRGCQAR